MNRLSKIALIVSASFCGLTAIAVSQSAQESSRSEIMPPSKEYMEQTRMIVQGISEAIEMERKGDYQGALNSYSQVTGLEKNGRGGTRSASGYYGQARMLEKLGKNMEALRAYSQTVWWNKNRDDLGTNGPLFSNVVMDYASLLGRMGYVDKAKDIYYAGIRESLNPSKLSWREPIPFLLLFDKEAGMEIVDPTPENFGAVTTLVKYLTGGMSDDSSFDTLGLALGSVPFYLVVQSRRHSKQADQWIGEASRNAGTLEEKDWIRAYAAGDKKSGVKLGVERRAKSTVLNNARLKLKSWIAN